MEFRTVLIAFGLTLFAGLATGVGSALAFFARRTNTKTLSVALGFSAGVMIYVSFVEIFFKAKECLVTELGAICGYWITVLAFFGGMLSWTRRWALHHAAGLGRLIDCRYDLSADRTPPGSGRLTETSQAP